MTVPKPLIAKTGKEQFRVSATANWADKCASVQVYSVTPEGKKLIDHASCEVKFFDCAAAELEWKRSSYLVKRSIQLLEDNALKGGAHRLQRGMVYKLFSALVDYDENYQSIREVILDSENHEATAFVKFQAPQDNFHRNPYWIDSFGHLSGFIMNASDTTDSKNQVFVNHGWDSMRCLKKFSPDVTYRTHVRMQPWRDSIWAGDVHIFDGDDVIAVYGGVKARHTPMNLIDSWPLTLANSSKLCHDESWILLFHQQAPQRREARRCSSLQPPRSLCKRKIQMPAGQSLQWP